MRKIISILLCLAMVLGSAASAFADTSKGTATTLRLEKTEGKVGITKTGGKSVTVKDGIRLYDGYHVNYDKKSAAYVSLDSSKAVMLDASTDVSIKKNGNKLDIMLKSGTILVNVEDKLKSNEELNIRTTNSVTGIRGTIAQFTYNPVTRNTEVYLFEGETEGMYLAPDGSWYSQKLVTGSWLASGMGMLADNPQYNGWTVGPNGEWIYTNNKLEGTEFRQWRWSTEQGWFTFDTQTGAITKEEAWPFTFKDLQPRVQKEILNNESMLSRGQEHLDLYPELAEDKLPETKAAAEEALAQQQEETEKKDEAIIAAFDEGNGGNSIDNLFAEQRPSRPSTPSFVTVSFNNNTTDTIVPSLTVDGTPVTANADGSYTIPYGKDYTFDLGEAASYKVTKPNGDYIARDNGLYTDNATGSIALTIDDMPTAGIHTVNVSFHDYPDEAWIASYGSNVLSVSTYTDPAVENGYIFTLEEGQTLSFTVGENESYGITGFESGTGTLTQLAQYDYSYVPVEAEEDIQFFLDPLTKVYSSNGTIVLAAGSATPLKTASDGGFLFEANSMVIIDTSGIGPGCEIIVDTSDPAFATPTVAAPVLTDNQFTAKIGYDYRLIYAPNGFSTVDISGAKAADITVASTSDMFYHYIFNTDEMYLVTPGSEFIFSVADATVTSDPTTFTPVDGYYHIPVTSENISLRVD